MTPQPEAPPPPAKVVTEPGTAAADISPSAPIGVGVTGGKLTDISLTSSDGKKVAGKLTPDHLRWTTTEPLEYAKTYTWSGNAAGAAGRSPVAGSFTTAKPAEQVRGTLNIGDDQTVGIAAPIIIEFGTTIQDKAAAERALSVQTSVPTEGSWAWLPDHPSEGSRVHWRPKDYWQPNTAVTVNANFYGVPFGNGAYGKENVSGRFTVGRSQVTKADVKSHQLIVVRDGQEVASYPASYGMDSVPDRNTRSGIHVVMGKSASQRMTSAQYGYDEVHPWAVRMSNNGEFIHSNSGTVGVQGSSNVSHGCVNLSTSNAKSYFDTVLYGDPVEVTGSNVELSQADGDIYDWTIPWEQWQTMSALHQAPAPQPAPAPAPVQQKPR
jgi:lipoprotein-anchoring transpeptidase ErfK/SrfK